MKVLLLGAGASKAAGYPLAAELIEAVESCVDCEGGNKHKQQMREWKSFLESLSGSLAALADCSNPEVVLSLPDLFGLALGSARTPNRDADELMRAGIRARHCFIDCLHLYFELRHCQDSRPENAGARRYLYPVMEEMAAGDAVITFNWDTLAERVLLEQGKWSPFTGFGFPVKLNLSSEEDPARLGSLIPDDFPTHSEVRVLKLHGSYGWSNLGDPALSHHFLHDMPVAWDGRLVRLQDPNYYSNCDFTPRMSVLLPSYLKTIGAKPLPAIWRQASDLLRRANSVKVIGYSLPESDTAARILLGVMAARCDSGEAVVKVMDPSTQSRKRWREFLGSNAIVSGESIHNLAPRG